MNNDNDEILKFTISSGPQLKRTKCQKQAHLVVCLWHDYLNRAGWTEFFAKRWGETNEKGSDSLSLNVCSLTDSFLLFPFSCDLQRKWFQGKIKVKIFWTVTVWSQLVAIFSQIPIFISFSLGYWPWERYPEGPSHVIQTTWSCSSKATYLVNPVLDNFHANAVGGHLLSNHLLSFAECS